jgi:hypothetical protein
MFSIELSFGANVGSEVSITYVAFVLYVCEIQRITYPKHPLEGKIIGLAIGRSTQTF